MAKVKPFFRLPTPAVLGEGPIYRFTDNTLHFNDCGSNKVFVLPIDPQTGDADPKRKLVCNDTSDSISVHCLRKGRPGSFICLYYQGIAFLDEATGKYEVLKELIPAAERHLRRMNDGAVDPQGRFWGGEVDKEAAGRGLIKCFDKTPTGRLWRYDPDGSIHQMETGLVCSNGIGWSPDLRTMYLNDSVGQKIYKYDYDNAGGTITNKQILKDFSATIEEPDGLVVDIDGNIWTALWSGSRVICVDPHGKTIKEVFVSAERPTCPTWGGKDNDTLYITSASADEGAHHNDDGGQLFKYKTDTHGMPKYEFAG